MSVRTLSGREAQVPWWVCTTLYMSPLHTQVGVPLRVYLSGCTSGCTSGCIQGGVYAVIPGLLRRGGSLCAEGCLSPLRINHCSQQKQTKRDQETRYRERLCTRTSRICQPLKRCLPAPLKVLARLYTPKRRGGLPRPRPIVPD